MRRERESEMITKESKECPFFSGWTKAATSGISAKLEEQEEAQFNRARLYEESSKKFDFVLGGKLNFRF